MPHHDHKDHDHRHHDHHHHHDHDHHHEHDHHPHDHHHHHDHGAPPAAGDGRWLIIDIGAGTQDILIHDPRLPLESSLKMVLPSPAQIAAGRIRAAAKDGRPVWLYGRLMGGGALTQAVKEHLAAGLKVYAQKDPALSLFDDLKRVEAMGVEITEAKPPETSPVQCGDVDLRGLAHALDHFGVSLPTRYAAAAQDHGFSAERSSREMRFETWRDFLEKGGDPVDLIYDRPPAYLTRLAGLAQALPGALVADSASAALLGALQDEEASAAVDRGLTVLNVGNGHTVAFLYRAGRVKGIYEHHTDLVSRELLTDHLARFRSGRLPDQEVRESNGHGCQVLEPGGYETTIITGPRRELARDLGRMAVVHGDLMLSGCFGLVEGARLKGAL